MTHREHVSKEEAAAFQARIVELEAELAQAQTRAEAAEQEVRELNTSRFSSVPARAIDDVLAERGRQNEKWGVQSHDPGTWLLILQEEIGEWSQAHLAMRFEGGSATECRKELVQVAAVALQMLEAHDRDLPVDLDQVVR